MELSQEQREAVEHGEGPLLIIAGAGTGKTTVITHRIAHLVISKRARPEEILALTFTDKAAQEMEERVDILIPYGYADITISTFHAFGDRVLRDNALDLGMRPDFRVLTYPEQIILFREHLFEFGLEYYRPLSDPTRHIDALLRVISRARDEDVSPEEYLRYVEALEPKRKGADPEFEEMFLKQRDVARAYQKYQELKARNNFIDFGDQVSLTLKILREHPGILRRYQERFRWILVDEFQDTNFAQFQILKLLAARHKNITVVADDDQCLPSGTLVDTPLGPRKIEDVKIGDKVICGVGKGYTSTAQVTKVFKKKKTARFLTFETEKGHKVTVTDNHKMFCLVPSSLDKKDIHYVYLMHRKNLGWRLGVTNSMATRIRFERSVDRMIGVRGFRSEEEAYFHELLWSLRYGIPTVCFMARKGLRITGEWLNKLYKDIDTDMNVRRLAHDMRIDLDAHHVCLDGVCRGNSTRVKIHLEMCYRRYRSKSGRGAILYSPKVLHIVHLQTSDENTLKKLEDSGVPLHVTKKGKVFKLHSTDIRQVGEMASRLQSITGGILESKFSAGTRNIQHRPALIMPASNVLLGHYLPVLEDSRIVYDRVTNISEEMKEDEVHDLEIEKTHNFIANKIVVHNSIYKWRGAAVSNILGFLDFYPEAVKAVLKENYRSPQEVLDTAYRLIKYNDPDRLEARYGIDKKLKSMRGAGALPRFFIYDTLSTEADQVAEVIERERKEKGYKPGDFAILVRDNRDAEPFLRSLNMKGIPWRFSGNRGLYAQEEVKVIISFLYTIADPHDSLNLFYLASSDLYRMNPIDLTDCMNAARRKNLSLFTVFKDMVQQGTVKISQEGMVTAAKIVEDIHAFVAMSQTMSTGQLLYRYLIDSGYLKKLTGSRSYKAAGQVQNISRFFEVVRAFEGLSPHDRVAQFVRHLDMLIEAGDDPATAEAEPDENAVNVLTVHKAKGLEFPIVFMVGLVTENFPTRRRGDPIELAFDLIKEPLPTGDIHLQEERRLFYVGMTRTREELYLTAARDYGGKRMRKVSPFVLEALDMSKVDAPVQKASAEECIQRSAPPAQASEGEVAYIAGAIPHLSYYQIDDYETCPLKYKFVHVLRVPIMSHHTVVYGKALHDAVQEYHRRKISSRPVSAEDLIDVYKGSWRSEGFISREHEQMRFQAGEKALRNFFAAQEASGLLPTYVEKEFSFQVDGLSIKGRWDRVDVRDEEVSVIDFKSSEVAGQEEADKKTRGSLQLSIYALAYKTIYGKLPDKVQLYFLESGLIGNARMKEKDMEKVLGIIRNAASGIAAQLYDSSPGWHCRFCAYMIICEGAQR